MGAPMAGLDLENMQVFESVTLTDNNGHPVTLSRESIAHADTHTVGFTGERVELKIGSTVIPFRVPNRVRTAMVSGASPEAFDRIVLKTPCSGQKVGLEIHKLRTSIYRLSLTTDRGSVAVSGEFRTSIGLYHGHQVVSR